MEAIIINEKDGDIVFTQNGITITRKDAIESLLYLIKEKDNYLIPSDRLALSVAVVALMDYKRNRIV